MDKVMIDISGEDLEKVFGNVDLVSVRELIDAVKDGLCELESQEEYYQDKIEDMKYENGWVYEYDPYDKMKDDE